MKKLSILFAALALVFSMAGTAVAIDIGNEINLLIASGKASNDVLNHCVVNLVKSSQGSVTATVYATAYETITVNQLLANAQEPSSCTNKITRFVFELTNQYRPATELAVGISADRLTANIYTAGERKDAAMASFVQGLVDCLNNIPYDRNKDPNLNPTLSAASSSGSSSGYDWIKPFAPSEMAKISDPVKAFKVAAFKVFANTYVVNGETKNMDVQSYAKGDLTYFPVRYLAYALGVSKDDIAWADEAKSVTITKGQTTVIMTIGDNTMMVNDKPIKMDVAPEISNSRTMLPARWLAEALGAEVSWDDATQQATIKIAQPGN